MSILDVFKRGDNVKDTSGKIWKVQGGAGNGSLMLKDRDGKTSTKYSGLVERVDVKDIPGG
jgi:hypothetical protein